MKMGCLHNDKYSKGQENKACVWPYLVASGTGPPSGQQGERQERPERAARSPHWEAAPVWTGWVLGRPLSQAGGQEEIGGRWELVPEENRPLGPWIAAASSSS